MFAFFSFHVFLLLNFIHYETSKSFRAESSQIFHLRSQRHFAELKQQNQKNPLLFITATMCLVTERKALNLKYYFLGKKMPQ